MPTSAKFVTGGGGFGWATSEAGNSVFKVSPRGYKVGEFSTGEGPESIAFDGDRLWVANYDSASVGWIDVASGTTGSLSVGHPVQGIAAGAGLVAFTVGRGRGVVDRVEALPGDVLRLTFPEQFNTVYDPALATDPGMFQVERATCLKLLNQPVAEAPEGWGLHRRPPRRCRTSRRTVAPTRSASEMGSASRRPLASPSRPRRSGIPSSARSRPRSARRRQVRG